MALRDKLEEIWETELKLLQYARDSATLQGVDLGADAIIIAKRMNRNQDLHVISCRGEDANHPAYRFWSTTRTRDLLNDRLERRTATERKAVYVAEAIF